MRLDIPQFNGFPSVPQPKAKLLGERAVSLSRPGMLAKRRAYVYNHESGSIGGKRGWSHI